MDYPGHLKITLFVDGVQLAPAHEWLHSGVDHFSGLISDQPFNGVKLEDPTDQALFIDDIFFGGAVPAPGAAALLGLALCARRRRRPER